MAKIYHKDHGFVITADQEQIKELLSKGGELVDKCSEYGKAEDRITEEYSAPVEVSKSQQKRLTRQRYHGN